jgi:hypothetical protein
MTKNDPLNSSRASDIKVVIIYDHFAGATRAKAALHRIADEMQLDIRWDVKPWRMNLLRFGPTAEEALGEAAHAEVVVLAGLQIHSWPLWLKAWLRRWAASRKVEDAVLAVLDDRRADYSPPTEELAGLSALCGLKFIGDSRAATGDEARSSMRDLIPPGPVVVPARGEVEAIRIEA